MKKLSIAAVSVFATIVILSGIAPAHAGGCPPGAVCVTVPAGSSASDIVDLVDAAWDQGDFACSKAAGDTLEVTDTLTGSIRRLRFFVPNAPGDVTDFAHTYQFQFLRPTEVPFLNETELGDPPFLNSVVYDTDPLTFVVEGTNTLQLDESLIIVTTTFNAGGSSGSEGPPPSSLPASDSTRTTILVSGLLLAGIGLIGLKS